MHTNSKKKVKFTIGKDHKPSINNIYWKSEVEKNLVVNNRDKKDYLAAEIILEYFNFEVETYYMKKYIYVRYTH